jgi:hypothetical protein
MHSYIVGIAEPDEKFQKMKAVYASCVEASIPVPDEVEEFFNYELPNDSGHKIHLSNITKIVVDEKCDSCDVYEIELKDLPKNVTKLRFVNSW